LRVVFSEVSYGAVVLVTSRSYQEYAAMFDLDPAGIGGAVVDCCAGASSFVAELAERGGAGIAADSVEAWPGAGP